MKIYHVVGFNVRTGQPVARHIEAHDGDEAARKWRRQVALETGQPESEFSAGAIIECNARS